MSKLTPEEVIAQCKRALEHVMASCVDPTTAKRAVMVELDPIRKALKSIDSLEINGKDL